MIKYLHSVGWPVSALGYFYRFLTLVEPADCTGTLCEFVSCFVLIPVVALFSLDIWNAGVLNLII